MKLPFTKIAPYYFTKLQRWTAEGLELLLQGFTYSEIRPEQSVSTGFVPAIEDEALVERIAPGVVYLRWKITEKKVPKKVLQDAMRPRIQKIEAQLGDGGRVPRADLMKIQDDCYAELIKVAFPTSKVIDVILTPTHALIGDPSWKRAEYILSDLRSALGSLPVRPLACRNGFDDLMTDRLLHRQDEDCRFKLGERFHAKAKDGKAEVKGNHVDVDRDEFQQLVDNGMKVVELELTYTPDDCETAIWFVLKKDGILKSVTWPPELSDKAAEDVGDDDAWQTLHRANLLMIYANLEELLKALQEWAGGLLFEGDADEPANPTAQLAAAVAALHARLQGQGMPLEMHQKFQYASAMCLADITGGTPVIDYEVRQILERLQAEHGDEEPEDDDTDLTDPDASNLAEEHEEDPLAGGTGGSDYDEDDLI